MEEYRRRLRERKENKVVSIYRLAEAESLTEFDRLRGFVEVQDLAAFWRRVGPTDPVERVRLCPSGLRRTLQVFEKATCWINIVSPCRRRGFDELIPAKRDATRERLRKAWSRRSVTGFVEDARHCILDTTVEIWLSHVREFGIEGSMLILSDWWRVVRERSGPKTWAEELDRGIGYALDQWNVVVPDNIRDRVVVAERLRGDTQFCTNTLLRSEIVWDNAGGAGAPWKPRQKCLIVTRAIAARYAL